MSKNLRSLIKKNGKFKLSDIELKSKEIMSSGIFKKIIIDSETRKKFRLLNSPFVLEIVRLPHQNKIKIYWYKREWKTIVKPVSKNKVSSKMIKEKPVKFEEVFRSEKISISYKKKLIFMMGTVLG